MKSRSSGEAWDGLGKRVETCGRVCSMWWFDVCRSATYPVTHVKESDKLVHSFQ
jgi:hypothetical protein